MSKRHSSKKDEPVESKKIKKETSIKVESATPGLAAGPATVSAMAIKEMMKDAMKKIEMKKQELLATVAANPKLATVISQAPVPNHALSRIEALKAQIEARVANKGLSAVPTGAPAPTGPVPLILDADGRTKDSLGREIKIPTYQPTSLANIRKIKLEKFQQITSTVKDDSSDTFNDPRVFAKPAIRPKKAFKFVEKGKYEQIAEKLRTKAKLEKLQNEISSAAKRTGIQSATTLALIVPKKEMGKTGTPEIEWWDSLIVESYENMATPHGITNLVEHPIQMKPPTESNKPVVLPIFLTKKERKKLRRQNRREVMKEKMERVRLGLDPPPEPKVKMSNMMRVLGQQQIQDPTKIEAHVREQMAKRQKAHEQMNAARKLTDEQRKEKKTRKIQEDTSLGVHVSLYRLSSLASQSKRFKVEMNAKQLHMTGCVVMYKNINLVIVEGGPKQQAKFRRLMLHRIKWEEDKVSKDGTETGEIVDNECALVWEGQVKNRSFGEVKVKTVQNDPQAREHFKKHNVEQYWDLGFSTTILKLAEKS